jgi:hypothetical protein
MKRSEIRDQRKGVFPGFRWRSIRATGFVLFFVARIERSEIRERRNGMCPRISLTLNPGYELLFSPDRSDEGEATTRFARI